MIQRLGSVLLMIGFLTSSYAQSDQEPAEGQKYTEAFWKVYTDALRGDKTAEFKVGVMYERGFGIDINETQAAAWYEKSAIQGNVDAQYNIGIMYASGRGVAQNDGFAMMWLALAAQQGDKESRHVLLQLIDQKALKRKEKSVDSQTAVNTVGTDEEIQAIAPVTLICKENSVICSKYGKEGECTPYKAKSALTSTSKRGLYYKISGTVSKKGWKEYAKEGWIEEDSVDIRH